MNGANMSHDTAQSPNAGVPLASAVLDGCDKAAFISSNFILSPFFDFSQPFPHTPSLSFLFTTVHCHSMKSLLCLPLRM